MFPRLAVQSRLANVVSSKGEGDFARSKDILGHLDMVKSPCVTLPLRGSSFLTGRHRVGRFSMAPFGDVTEKGLRKV